LSFSKLDQFQNVYWSFSFANVVSVIIWEGTIIQRIFSLRRTKDSLPSRQNKYYSKTHIVLLNCLKIVFRNFVPLRAAGKVLWLILGPNVKSDLTYAEYKQNQV
jgi:hypothetical protein